MKSYQGNDAYIALCFSTENRNAAEQIAAALNAERFRVWGCKKGCRIREPEELGRFASAYTVMILISKEWLADDDCILQLQGAAKLEKPTVLLFLDGADLTGNPAIQAVVNRSMRMIDFDPQHTEECMAELRDLTCITDCQMAPDEKPNVKKTGLFR